MLLIWFVTLIIILICSYDLTIRNSRVWRMLARQFPGETALPLVGNALQLGTTSDDVHMNLRRLWAKHGMKNFRVMFWTEPMLMLCEAEDAKIILGSNVEISKSDQTLRTQSEHFGNSMALAIGDRWRVMRKILTPSFHFKLLDQYLDVANSEGNRLVEKLRCHVDKPAFNIYNYIMLYTLDVICRTAMGVEVNAQDGGGQEYLTASLKILPISIKRFYSAWYRHDFIYKRSALGREGQDILKTIKETADRIIAHRRQEFEKNIRPLVSSEEDVVDFITKNRTDLTFIDVMLLSKMPDGSPIPDEYIREETNLILFAGFDTTLTTLSFILSSLAKHKECQEKAYQEQLEIFGEDLTIESTPKDLSSMKYLQRFIKESMRIYPTVPQYSRRINNDLVLHDGKVIPGGTNVSFYVSGIHMNPKYFPDPEKFDPDRFLEPVPIYNYIPFSAGPRNCIGMNFAWMSMRSVLSKILRHYELSLESAQDEPRPVNEFLLVSRNGFKVKLTERSKK